MSICRPHAFQHRSTVYIYTFIWMEAKKCVAFRILNGIKMVNVNLAYWLQYPGQNRLQAESFVNVLVSFLRRPFAKCIPSLSVRFYLSKRHLIPLVLKLAGLAPISSPGFLFQQEVYFFNCSLFYRLFKFKPEFPKRKKCLGLVCGMPFAFLPTRSVEGDTHSFCPYMRVLGFFSFFFFIFFL